MKNITPYSRTKMRRSYKKFYDSLDEIAPVQEVVYNIGKTKWKNKNRVFFGMPFYTKKAIMNYVKTFPQWEDWVYDYKEYDLSKAMWDMALVIWISAIRFEDWDYADKVRAIVNERGIVLSRFKGNVFMRTP